MAVFSLGSGTELNSLDDMSKVRSYLFQLTEQLRYMFNNLDPQENYSELARLTLVTDGERQATIEASLDAIRFNYVSKDGIVSAINLSEELIQIEASKIKLEGVVTVNGNFKVGLDGSIEATNGKFNGDIEASNITGSSISASNIEGTNITGSHIQGTTIGTTNEAFYVLPDEYDGSPTTKIGMSGFSIENHRIKSNSIGSWENPVTGDDERIVLFSDDGSAGIEIIYTSLLYVDGVRRDIASEIAALWERIEDMDDGGEDPPVGGDPI